MVTSKKFAIRNFVYFCMNFPHDFIEKIWKGNQQAINNYKQKWERAYQRHGTAAIPFLFIELDAENQDIFSNWINENYKGFEEFHQPNNDDIDRVEKKWIEREKTLGLKRGTVKHAEEECSFFVGAMSALDIQPMKWTMPLISGRLISDFITHD